MAERPEPATWIALGRAGGDVLVAELDAEGAELARARMPAADLTDWVSAREATSATRWIWNDTTSWYPDLLAGGVRVERCHDLRLCHAILRDSALAGATESLRLSLIHI